MDDTRDLIILGSGCAGLTAAIYSCRAGLDTLIIENAVSGGQTATASDIGNYPGVPEITGAELMEKMLVQARGYGAEIKSCTVTAAKLSGNIKTIETSGGTFHSKTALIATGAAPRSAGFDGEEKFRGKGVSYCATCDGFFFRGMDVYVIGGGNSAAEEAVFLTRFARKVTMLVRKNVLRCEKRTAEKVLSHPKIEVRFNTELTHVSGENAVTLLELKNNLTDKTEVIAAGENEKFGVFVFAGYEPSSTLFRDALTLDETGYIVTDENMATALPGVFAAGDVRAKSLRQIITAAADGAIAATQAEKYLNS